MRSLLTDVCLLSGNTRTEPLIRCLRHKQSREYTVPYSVPEVTFCFKRVHHEKVVDQELGDQSIKNSHHSHLTLHKMFWKRLML